LALPRCLPPGLGTPCRKPPVRPRRLSASLLALTLCILEERERELRPHFSDCFPSPCSRQGGGRRKPISAARDYPAGLRLGPQERLISTTSPNSLGSSSTARRTSVREGSPSVTLPFQRCWSVSIPSCSIPDRKQRHHDAGPIRSRETSWGSAAKL